MKLKLESKLLIDICQDIKSQRATWALLRANEYLDVHDPLRKALVKKAKTALTSIPMTETLQQVVIHGKTYLELNDIQRNEVLHLDQGKRKINSQVVFLTSIKNSKSIWHQLRKERLNRLRTSGRVLQFDHKLG